MVTPASSESHPLFTMAEFSAELENVGFGGGAGTRLVNALVRKYIHPLERSAHDIVCYEQTRRLNDFEVVISLPNLKDQFFEASVAPRIGARSAEALQLLIQRILLDPPMSDRR